MFRLAAVNNHRQRIDRFGINQNSELHQVTFFVARDGVVETGIAAADRFQPIVEIEHDLVQRQLVNQHGAATGISEVLLDTAAVLAQLQDRAEMIIGHQDRRFDPRLLDISDAHDVGHVGGIVHLQHFPVIQMNAVDHRRRRRDQIKIEFAAEPFLHDFEMQQAEKPAAETETECRRIFRFVMKAAVIQAQLSHAVA